MPALFSDNCVRLAGLTLTAICLISVSAPAQKRRPAKSNSIQKRAPAAQPKRAAPNYAVVVDERLAVLRFEPSLSAMPLQRMRSGRTIQILGEREADGVTFYRVQLPPEKTGWVQAEAVAAAARRGDDERLAQLIRASESFEQIERASIFLEIFTASALRPAVLLLFGDLAEIAAQRLSREAARRFDAEEMRASGAPVHSFYLNYSGLDRYRRLGVNFVFNQKTKEFHYEGASWREILQKHRASAESAEARKRLESLSEKTRQ